MRLLRALAPTLLLVLPLAAPAQEAACPAGNLLAGLRPAQSSGVVAANRLTDDAAPAEGDGWKTSYTTVFNGTDAHVVFDLGVERRVEALLLQGDNNDTYEVAISSDGQQFTPIWTAPEHPHPGMRTRLAQGLSASGRYLRIGGAKGDDSYSLGEVQAFCKTPRIWPPPMTVHAASTETKAPADTRKVTMAWGKMLVGAGGLLVFLGILLGTRVRPLRWLAVAAGAALVIGSTRMAHGWVGALVGGGLVVAWLVSIFVKKEEEQRWKLLERGALLAVVVASTYGWTNFGTFHGSRVVHYWDTFHYYVGSKYFPELRYTLLYHCANVAEIEDGRRHEVVERKIRDLRDNTLGPATYVADDTKRCEEAFTPERWAAFKQDLRLFRAEMGKSWWEKMFKDHGYNASPVWTMTGNAISAWGWKDDSRPDDQAYVPSTLRNKSPAEREALRKQFDADRAEFRDRIEGIARIDFALYAGMFLLLLWAFGLRACALAMLLWGSGYPWAYFWTGGSFGRIPWLFMIVASVCLLKKGYQALGGGAMTWGMLLRAFPGAIIAGMVGKIAHGVLKHRTITRPHQRFILGCTVALVVLMAGGALRGGGFHVYGEFLENSNKHVETPLTNHMGLPTLFSWHPDLIARKTRDNKLDDPFLVWKEKRRETLKNRKVFYWATVLGLFALLAYTARRLEDWEATSLSAIMICAMFELTCYYYNFMFVLAPLALRRLRYVVVLIGASIVSQIIQLRVGWYDEQYLWESLLCFAVMLYFLVDLFREVRAAERAEKAPAKDAKIPAPEAQPA